MPINSRTIVRAGNGIDVTGGQLVAIEGTVYALLSNAGSAGGVVVADENGEVPAIWIPASGTQAFFESAVPDDGEIVLTDKLTPRLGDGSTPGGLDFALNSGSAVFVQPRRTAAASGAALLAAYTRAKALTPGGSAVSATNRAKLIVGPGDYDISAQGVLDLDTEGVDVLGLFGSYQTRIIGQDSATGYVKYSANNVTCQGFTLAQSSSSSSQIAVFAATSSGGIVHRDLVYDVVTQATGRCVAFDGAVTSLAGLYENIRADGQRLYGGAELSGGVSATFRDCNTLAATSVLGLHFGSGPSGVTYNTFTGVIDNCRSYGNHYLYVTGAVSGSRFRAGSANIDCLKVGAGALVIDCRFYCNGTGYALGIAGSETPTISADGLKIKPGTGGEAIHANITNNISSAAVNADADYPVGMI